MREDKDELNNSAGTFLFGFYGKMPAQKNMKIFGCVFNRIIIPKVIRAAGQGSLAPCNPAMRRTPVSLLK
ncbi:hypothetical protein ACS25B_16605 [Dickeya dadantii subsp. dieffenbachiae]|uniref:hypothetical protein n=1 Tax=Dickeya dadantii TaxID=204038 RepID=UPI0005773C95|nr:hypothetical protein [Dickeya dadantii]